MTRLASHAGLTQCPEVQPLLHIDEYYTGDLSQDKVTSEVLMNFLKGILQTLFTFSETMYMRKASGYEVFSSLLLVYFF